LRFDFSVVLVAWNIHHTPFQIAYIFGKLVFPRRTSHGVF
jgi:hypothetical protein